MREMSELEIYQGKDLTIDLEKPKKEYSFGKYLEKDAVNQLLSLIPHNSSKHHMFFQFLWRTGVRVTEAINIKKEQINFKDGFIEIRWLKNRKYHKRIIPMHSSLKNGLMVYCAALKSEERLFPWSRQNSDFYAKKYKFGHCHVLRHSFAVNFIKQNKNAWALNILQKLMGHSRIQTTMKYLEAVPVDQAAALELVRFD